MTPKELYSRFRTWQKTPSRNWEEGVTTHCCPNCGHEFTGRYCPLCGQQAGDGRITWRWVWKSILDVWGMDSQSLPYTLLQLLIRPGYLISDYISGHRQVCYKPVNMLFIVAIFYVIIAQLLGHNVSSAELPTDNETNSLLSVFSWISTHPAWTAISLTTIMILPTYLLFRFAPRHTRHTLPESIFIQLFMCTLILICSLATILLDGLFWLVPFYYYITYRQFFGYRPWGTLWRLLVSAFVWLFLLSSVFITLLIITGADQLALNEDRMFVNYDIDNNGSLLLLASFLLLAALPLTIGYRIGKKRAHTQSADIQQ